MAKTAMLDKEKEAELLGTSMPVPPSFLCLQPLSTSVFCPDHAVSSCQGYTAASTCLEAQHVWEFSIFQMCPSGGGESTAHLVAGCICDPGSAEAFHVKARIM